MTTRTIMHYMFVQECYWSAVL